MNKIVDSIAKKTRRASIPNSCFFSSETLVHHLITSTIKHVIEKKWSGWQHLHLCNMWKWFNFSKKKKLASPPPSSVPITSLADATAFRVYLVWWWDLRGTLRTSFPPIPVLGRRRCRRTRMRFRQRKNVTSHLEEFFSSTRYFLVGNDSSCNVFEHFIFFRQNIFLLGRGQILFDVWNNLFFH